MTGVVSVRLPEAEKAALEAAAARSRLSVSEFVRRVLARFVADPEPEPEPAEVAPPTPPAAWHVVNVYSSFDAYRAESPFATRGPAIPAGGSMREIP